MWLWKQSLPLFSQKKFKDPFGDVIKTIMEQIHTQAGLSPLCEFGTQNYEQWVVLTEQNGKSQQHVPYGLQGG